MIGKIVTFLVVVAVAFAYAPGSLDGVDPRTLECDPPGDSVRHLLLPDYTNCSNFYTCANGVQVLRECASAGVFGFLHFNFENQTCAWPEIGDCKWVKIVDGSGDGSDVDTFMPEAFIENFDDLPEISPLEALMNNHFSSLLDCGSVSSAAKQVAYVGDCARYWRCTDGLVQASRCADGLFFNQQSQQCDFENNVKCGYHHEQELTGEFIVYN